MYGLADNKWVSLVVFSSFAARYGRLKMDHVGKGRELLFSTFERLCDATKIISIHPPTHSSRRPRKRNIPLSFIQPHYERRQPQQSAPKALHAHPNEPSIHFRQGYPLNMHFSSFFFMFSFFLRFVFQSLSNNYCYGGIISSSELRTTGGQGRQAYILKTLTR